ncbi:unnamed protein product [Adineta ricciae]|uniref:WD repeat domain phosphoinositide-interacting protein 2 n=1 Tax=Adineta ricciae TaxID=249248 RepID=A0A815CYL0_ADIRI|nr:unnamed protein product [Adineta ricciae]CAF1290031.1 unnamed protein product [Adineta ricciae]
MSFVTDKTQADETNRSGNSATSAHDSVLRLSFNQDYTSLAMGTIKSYFLYTIAQENQTIENRNFEIRPFPNIHQLPYDNVRIIERLYASSLLAVVSDQAPRKLKVCHFKKGTEICSISFPNNIRSVKLNRLKLIVCLDESIYIYNMRDMKVVHMIRDVPVNPDGLCALSSDDKSQYLAYPGSSITGEIQIFDISNLKSGVIISAHDSPLVAMEFDGNGARIATASNKGTVIRIHSVTDGTRLFEFRRGIRRVATIYCFAFSPDSNFLAASSSTGTIHIFRLVTQKEKPTEAPVSWMGTFSRVLEDVAYYLPKQTSEVLTQERAFATVHHPSSETKTIIAITASTDALKLFVAGYDGIVHTYEINTRDGGECQLMNQYSLFQISSSDQTNTFHDGATRKYPPNLLRNETNAIVLTNNAQLADQTYNTAIEQDSFPPLPSPSLGGYDE